MKLQMILQVAVFGSLVACAPGVGAHADTNTVQVKTVTVNGQKPDEYFKQFDYRVVGKCSDQGGVWFHFLSSYQESIQLPNAPDGRSRRATLSLYLDDDGSYSADFTKESFIKTTPDTTFWEIDSKARLSGMTKIDEAGKMIIENVGVLSALKFNNEPAAKLSIENTVLTEGLANPSVIMLKVDSTSGREAYNVVCPGAY